MIATRAEILVYMGKASSLSDEEDALLALVHRASDAAIQTYMQQQLHYQQHVELLPIGQPISPPDQIQQPYLRSDGGAVLLHGRPGVGSEALQLKHLPVFIEALEVREDLNANAGQANDAFPDSTIISRGTDYWLDVDDPANEMSRTGLLYRFGAWSTEPRSIKVTYYGGHTTARLNNQWADIKLAAIIAAAEEFQVAKRRQNESGVIQSETIGKYSYTLAGDAGSVASAGGYRLPAGAIQRLFPHRNLGRLFA